MMKNAQILRVLIIATISIMVSTNFVLAQQSGRFRERLKEIIQERKASSGSDDQAQAITDYKKASALPGDMPADVPAEFQDLYAQLQNYLTNFNATLNSQWDGSTYPTVYAAALVTADANRGRVLLNPGVRDSIQLEITHLKALGVKAVTVTLGFPILYQPFYQWNGNPDDYQKMVDFYKELASDIHSQGLKMIVESQVLIPPYSIAAGSGFKLSEYYATLSESDYLAGRSANINNILQLIKPDYLGLGQEPDTLVLATGQKLASTPDGYLKEINYFLKNLPSSGRGEVLIGAGVGTWTRNGTAYIQNLATQTTLDYIDMHVHPVNHDFLPNILKFADIAISNGKKVTMSEALLAKERDLELSMDFAKHTAALSRDVYSFWAPLDQEFLQTIVKAANFKHFEFVAVGFWNYYLSAYLDYYNIPGCPAPPGTSCSPTQLRGLEQRAVAMARKNNVYSDTGLKYKSLISSGQSGHGAIFCTQEAKLCPDGSSVGRVPPNCEFAPCP